jgi:hypothetical protein
MAFQQAYGCDIKFYGHASGKNRIPSQVFRKIGFKQRDADISESDTDTQGTRKSSALQY